MEVFIRNEKGVLVGPVCGSEEVCESVNSLLDQDMYDIYFKEFIKDYYREKKEHIEWIEEVNIKFPDHRKYRIDINEHMENYLRSKIKILSADKDILTIQIDQINSKQKVLKTLLNGGISRETLSEDIEHILRDGMNLTLEEE